MKFRIGRGAVCMGSVLAFAVAGSVARAHEAGPSDAVTAMAQKFAAREAVRQISLSPDGKSVAYLASTDPRGEVVTVARLADGQSKAILTAPGGDQHISGCNWISNERLLCRYRAIRDVTGMLLTFTRMLAVDAQSGAFKVLFESRSAFRQLSFRQSGGDLIDLDGGKPGSVLLTRDYAKEMSTGTRLAETREGLGVDRLDTASLRRSVIEQPKATAIDYISDGHGNVRVMGSEGTTSAGYAATHVDYFYRDAQGGVWKPLSQQDYTGAGWTGFEPQAVDRDLDVAYGFQDHDGFQALYRMKLDGSGARELVASEEGVDIDDLVRIGRSRRVVGVSYVRDYRVAQIFDPQIKAVLDALAKALPASKQIRLLDASEDENVLLVEVGSDDDPGTIYLFDRKSHELRDLLLIRPALENMKLAKMKPVTFPAADGTQIPAYLTLPPGKESAKGLPAIVLPHGGPSARDEWGFDWLVQFYAQRGYAVLQPNYRGSAGYGEDWLMRNGFQSWRSAIGDIDDAGRWLLAQGIAAPGKLAIVGWSYGGYAALQSGVTEPGLYKAIVAIAPVTDLELLRSEAHDFSNYTFVDRQIGTGPHVRAGSPAQQAERIAVPVLLMHGSLDQNVDIRQSELMQGKLESAHKPVEFVRFDGLAHSLDDTAARTQVLADSDVFLRRTMGID